METDPSADAEPGLYVIAVQADFVIARTRLLAPVRECGGVVFSACGRVESPDGHHHYVAQVVAARAAEVGVAETVNQRIGIVVAAASVPVAAVRPGVGAQLHHTERISRTGEGVTVKVSAHKGVDQ